MCSCLSSAPYWGPNLTCNPGMCPDQESNRQPFGSQAGTQSTEPHQPGLILTFEEGSSSMKKRTPRSDTGGTEHSLCRCVGYQPRKKTWCSLFCVTSPVPFVSLFMKMVTAISKGGASSMERTQTEALGGGLTPGF